MTSPGPVKRQRVAKKPAGRFHHGDLRAAALAEAFRIVDEGGAEALSVRALAKRLGVSDPAIYRHYASREDLLAEVARHGTVGLMQAMAASSTPDDDPASALEAAGRAYLRYACDHRGWFRLFFSADQQDTAFTDEARAAALFAAAGAAEALLKAHLAKVVPAAHVDDHYRAFWGIAHGLSALVMERAFRRVTTQAAREEVALRAMALHVAAVCGPRAGAVARRSGPSV